MRFRLFAVLIILFVSSILAEPDCPLIIFPKIDKGGQARQPFLP